MPRDDAPGSIREEDVSPPATRVVVPDVLAMHLQHPNPALLKRPGSRGGGGGGGLGTLHPMSVSGRRGRFVPVALVVVFMFFVAVYRCAERPRLHNDRLRHPPSAPPARLTRLRRPLTEPRLDPARSRSFPRRESTMLAERANESGSLSHFRATPRGVPSETSSSLASSRSTSGPDSSSSSSPSRRWQLDALGAAHRDVAGETAKLAAEVKRLSQSVQASARTVRDDPYPEYVPRYLTDADARTERERERDRDRVLPSVVRASPPAKTGDTNRHIGGGGSFPRPASDAPVTGASGSDARAGRVPSGGWRRVPADDEKRLRVRAAMRDAWAAYERLAMGSDELQPQSRRGKNFFGGLGATIIDSLDTLWIMGLSDEYARAREWVAETLHFEKNYEASVFETTIRIVGGLVAAYDLSGDEMYLEKCTDLLEHLKPAFGTKTGVPCSIVNLRTGEAKNPGWSGGASMIAEFGTLQMEFIALSERTGDGRWRDMAEKIVEAVRDAKGTKNAPDGLWPIFFDPNRGAFTNAKVSFGAMGDSWYEYLLKVWVQGGRTPAMRGWHDEWEESMRGMIDKLVFPGQEPGTAYVGELNQNRVVHKMDHLACFVGGMLALGSEGSKHRDEYLDVAASVTKMCYRMYSTQPTGLAPEYVNFANKQMHVGAKFNIQRPETIESIFYMWRKTGDDTYREWAWNIFLSMEKWYKTDTGWAGVKDVRVTPPGHDDTMQSFFLAETLKYMYLMFCDSDVIHLDEWVFNTEAHPIRVRPRDATLVTPRA